MRTYNSLLIFLALVIISIAGCKKDSQTTSTDITFVNQTDESVTLDIYGSKDDYTSNSNLLERKQLSAGELLVLESNAVSSGKTYFIDWYTADYYYNNWLNDDYSNTGYQVQISPKAGNSTYYLSKSLKGNSRLSFLKGNKLETGWLAVGAYLYSNGQGYSNQWSNLNDNEKFKKLTIRKNFTATYTKKLPDGTETTQEFNFLVQQADVPYLEFKDNAGNTLGNITGGKLPTSTLPDFKSNSIDTLLALFPDNDYYFMLTRQ